MSYTSFLSASGYSESAKSFQKETKLDVKTLKLESVKSLADIFKSSPLTKEAATPSKKSKVSDSDSSDDSSSEDEKPVPKKAAPAVAAKPAAKAAAATKKVESSDSESSDDSSSEDEKPVPKKAAPAVAAKPAAKAVAAAKKAESSDSESSDDSSSEDEKPVPKKAAPAVAAKPAAKAAAATKKVESSDSESSDDSSSEDEKPVPKKAAPAVAAKPAAKAVAAAKKAESSSEDSEDSEDEDEKPVVKKPASAATTPAKSAPVSAPTSTNKPTTPSTSGNEFRIYVRGLPWVAKEAEVTDFFKTAGKPISVELPLDENGRSSGTAFVKFATKAEFDASLELDGQLWPGTERWLKIVESSEKTPKKTFELGPRPDGCNTIFIGNLSWDITEELIRETFKSAGEISQVRFAQDENGAFKGFGHVEFVDGESTAEAVKLAGTNVAGRPIRCDYAPPRDRSSFGSGGRGGAGGRSPGRGGGRGAGGRGGRGGAPATGNKNKGTIAAVGSGKKVKFGEDDDE